jgi:hypothetical protein
MLEVHVPEWVWGLAPRDVTSPGLNWRCHVHLPLDTVVRRVHSVVSFRRGGELSQPINLAEDALDPLAFEGDRARTDSQLHHCTTHPPDVLSGVKEL